MRLWRNPRLSIDTESTSMFEYQQPDALGHFGIYGGSFAAETPVSYTHLTLPTKA